MKDWGVEGSIEVDNMLGSILDGEVVRDGCFMSVIGERKGTCFGV